MRRWDRLLDAYVEEYRARGLSPQSVAYTQARLDRWGRWLKGRRPRVSIEHIDAEMITRYVASCSSFRAKATVYATLSTMRGFGDYLVRQGLWLINPLRWMKGPKVTPYSRLPKRIDHAHMEAMWREAANRHGKYSSHLWVTVLALLYGTGLRRGELERLNLDAFDRVEGTLRIDGRKTGQERCVPLPEMVLQCLDAYLPLRHNQDRKSTRLNSSHTVISYAVFCLKKKTTHEQLNIGAFNLQTSELLKIFLVMFFAAFFSDYFDRLTLGSLRLGPIRLPSFKQLGPF